MELKIRKSVTHQNIGGQTIVIDDNVTKNLTAKTVINRAESGNIACQHFIARRPDFDEDFPYKLYYGKVGILGYIVAEDEIFDEDSDILNL